jgi:hypothetical protein
MVKRMLHSTTLLFLLWCLLITGCTDKTTHQRQPGPDQFFSSCQAPGLDFFSGNQTIPRKELSALFSPPPGNEQDNNNPDSHFLSSLKDKQEVAGWVQDHYTEYYQKYNLSCEAAIIRLVCGIWGIDDLSEDDILDLMPRHPSNPDLGLVMENIQGDVYHPDGTINWGNYGTHAPVVKQTLETIVKNKKLDSLYRIEQKILDNKQLITFIKEEDACLGAIIWVAAYINGDKPPVNGTGQVLGEHVQYVSPLLDSRDRMLVYDVWPWDHQPFHLFVPFNRDMFQYETLLIMRKK